MTTNGSEDQPTPRLSATQLAEEYRELRSIVTSQIGDMDDEQLDAWMGAITPEAAQAFTAATSLGDELAAAVLEEGDPLAGQSGEVSPSDVVQVVVHGALFPHLRSWLEGHGFGVTGWPVRDALQTFIVTPSQEAWEAAVQPEDASPVR